MPNRLPSATDKQLDEILQGIAALEASKLWAQMPKINIGDDENPKLAIVAGQDAIYNLLLSGARRGYAIGSGSHKSS